MGQCTTDDIRQVMKDWIDEATNDTLECVWNDNFDGNISYDPEQGVFEISDEEADRVGIL
jgi:hypothetical protein